MTRRRRMGSLAMGAAALLAACGDDGADRPTPPIEPEPAVVEDPDDRSEPRERTDPTEDPAPSEPTAEVEPAAPMPPPEPPQADLKRALWPTSPDAVSVVLTQPYRDSEIVLFRLRSVEAWRARERAAGTLDATEARLDEAAERCDEENAGNEGSLTSCYADLVPGEPAVGWERWGARVHRLMLARVRWNRDHTEAQLEVRRALFELSTLEDATEDEVRVRDVDGDGEAEITVIAAVAPPSHYSGESDEGQIGYVLAWSDLHTQFRTSRRYVGEHGDAGPNTTTVETTWRAADRNGDGHADLHVRERREHLDDDQPELTASRRAGTRTVDCIWSEPGDVWRCPEALGAELLELGGAP